MKLWAYSILPLVFFFQTGCASKGFNRGAINEQIGVLKPKYDDVAIKEAFAKKANLPKPFKLGVYFKNPAGRSQTWRWTEADKAVLEEVAQDLKVSGVVSDVFPVMNSIATDEDLKSLRLAAAKHHADALLVIGGAGDIDRYINHAGWSYIVLLPALFVPGSEVDTLFVANATLWDVRNEFLYLTAETEATTDKTYVAAFGPTDKVLLEEAKTKALAKLKIELTKMVKGAKL